MAKIVPGQKYADLGQYDAFDDYKEMLTFLKGLGNTYRETKQEYEAEQVSSMTMLNNLIDAAENPKQVQFVADNYDNLPMSESDNSQINLYREMVDFKIGDKKSKYESLDRNLSTWMNKVSSSDNSMSLSMLDSTPGNLVEVWKVHKDMPDRGEGAIQNLISEFANLNTLKQQITDTYGEKNPAHLIKYTDSKNNQVEISVGQIKYNLNKYDERLNTLVYGLLEDRIITEEEAMLWSSVTGEGLGTAKKAYWETKDKKFQYFKAGHDRAGKGLSEGIKLLAKSTEDGSFGAEIMQSITSQDGVTQNTLTNAGKQSILDLARSPGIVEAYGYRDLSMLSSPEEIAAYIEDDILKERISGMDVNALTNYTLMKSVDEKAMFEKGLDAYGYTSYYKYESTDQAKAEERRKIKELQEKIKEEEERKNMLATGSTPGETDYERRVRLGLPTDTEAEDERYPVSGETEQEAVSRQELREGDTELVETDAQREQRLFDTRKAEAFKNISVDLDTSEKRKAEALRGVSIDIPESQKVMSVKDIQENLAKKVQDESWKNRLKNVTPNLQEVSKVEQDLNIKIDNPEEASEDATLVHEAVNEGIEMANAGEDYDWSWLYSIPGDAKDKAVEFYKGQRTDVKVAEGFVAAYYAPDFIKGTIHHAQHLHSQLRLPKDIINTALTDPKIAKIGTAVSKRAEEILNLENALKNPAKNLKEWQIKQAAGVTQSKIDKLKASQKHRVKGIIDYLAKKYPNVNRVHLERAFDMRNKTTWNWFNAKNYIETKYKNSSQYLFKKTQQLGKAGGAYMVYNAGFALSNWASNAVAGEDASTSVNRVGGVGALGLTYKLYNIMNTPAGKAAFKKFLYKSLGKKAATTIGSAFVSGPGAVIVALASTGMLGYDIYNFISNYDEEKGVVSNLKEQGYVAETEVGY